MSSSERKPWVLDTETKGTGARMVPLELIERKPGPGTGLIVVQPHPKRPQEPEPRPPRRFQVVDALSREVLAADAGTRETIELLEGVCRPVDVSVSVWEPGQGRWQLLSPEEKRLLWKFRGRRPRS